MIFRSILLKFLTILVFIFIAKNSVAYDLSVGLGNLTEHIGKIQTDGNGTLNLIDFNPYLEVVSDFEVTKSLFFSPELAITIPRSSGDSNISHWSFFTLLNAKYKYQKYSFIFGTGLYFTRISGDGGEEKLDNGTGKTSFILPDHAVISRNLILNIAASYNFYENYHAEIQILINNLLTSEDRSASIGMKVNYHFGEVL